MTVRTTARNVTFNLAFQLPCMESAYPPGTYRIETDEEALDTLSFLAYRRVATRIHLTKPGLIEVHTIDAKSLELALARDAAA
jgi:hypothetical protein